MEPTLQRGLYFPTPIYVADLAGSESFNATITPLIYDWRADNPAGLPNELQIGCWRSRTDIHRHPECAWLATSILAAAQSVFDELGYDPAWAPAFDTMWFNVNPPHGFNRSHMHPNSLWSGVYYVQAPIDCGRISFPDPRAQASVMLPRYEQPASARPPEAWNSVYFEAIAGRLILFPGWLQHAVDPNMSQGDRVSVGFNIVQSPGANVTARSHAEPFPAHSQRRAIEPTECKKPRIDAGFCNSDRQID